MSGVSHINRTAYFRDEFAGWVKKGIRVHLNVFPILSEIQLNLFYLIFLKCYRGIQVGAGWFAKNQLMPLGPYLGFSENTG